MVLHNFNIKMHVKLYLPQKATNYQPRLHEVLLYFRSKDYGTQERNSILIRKRFNGFASEVRQRVCFFFFP